MRRHQGLRLRAAKLAAAAAALKRQSGPHLKFGEPPFSLAFLTDAHRAPHPLLVARVLPRESAVILRDYTMRGRAGLAAQLKSVCSARGVKLIVGADMALAKRIGADGVHLPRWFSPAGPLPGAMIVTASAHDAQELKRAKELGADLALLSPAFPTGSHPDSESLGAAALKRLAAASPVPVLALGGVDETNAPMLAGPNVAGLAAIGAFLD
ncbi:thiamine phosphate synthase [Hyphococcus luteus]|uniref:Thiamine phosphate synthase n=1 Tax=Hyphococcus luteus TaxID=2058213 RepID=A0A2S7K8K7_9PROT|nr:thiamine phosphate synthase [Marinicaulis flavus]PQA88813.1 thiamine phosphate synthase [Marinicaulis flavus]